MFQVYNCLAFQHDHRLVALAALVCVLTVSTQIKLLRMIAVRREPYRSIWLGVTACVTAIGVWATHFVAMLAYDPGISLSYAPGVTAVSLLAAIVLIGAGLYVTQTRGLRIAPAIGGAVVGLGVGVMHYSGMSAVRLHGHLTWNPTIVAASLVVGAVLAAAAMTMFTRRVSAKGSVWAGVLMVLAICGLHFLGMGAVTVVQDQTIAIPREAVASHTLAIVVAGSAVLVLLLSVVAVVLERHQKTVGDRRMLELANAAVEGLAVCEDDRITTVNASLERMLAMTATELVGRPLGSLIADLPDFNTAQLEDGIHIEAEIVSATGERIPVELAGRAMRFNGGQRVGVAVRDLRDSIAAESKIRFLAHNDSLTGLANRASFNDRVEQEFQRHRRKGDQFAVLCLDLDRFKQVNDVFGHAAGDAVLQAAGERITAVLGEKDVLARLGGDEFAIIHSGDCSVEALARLGRDIVEAMAAEVDFGGRSATVGVSVGIAVFPDDGATPDALLRSADAALYKAKSDGRNTHRFFEAEMGAELRERQAMEFDLRRAIDNGELHMVYQPQTSIRTQRTFGFEALLRWTHPERGEVSPSVFIPMAEEAGLIMAIGEWVLRQSCAEAASWPEPLLIAVNLSGAQLRASNLADSIAGILAETGLEPSRLELEITETAMVEDFAKALHTLNALKALGVKVAMDDFGTGYSSLSTLRAFPFDKIKIDQTFVRNVQTNHEAATIVRAIVGLGRGLNLTVLAEGVESLEELAFLDEELCAEAQGFLFGRPGDISLFDVEVGRKPSVASKAA
jgi:diguanylate cyclase (GGDEF)-like protein/PAS domain S-box-containing protein